MKTSLGGKRLGDGSKLSIDQKTWYRSTHDLSKAVRTSMTVGTLVPIMTEFMQKGDVWDIDIESLIRTYPTNGPVFGSFKLQVDVFTADIRLYNKQLHNNTTKLGMNMQNVLFPLMTLNTKNPKRDGGELNIQQIAPDSLLAYVGVRGCGTLPSLSGNNRVEIQRNAMPILMYYEIFKEYYSNKQEEIGYVITPKIEQAERPIFERASHTPFGSLPATLKINRNEYWDEETSEYNDVYIGSERDGYRVIIYGENIVKGSIRILVKEPTPGWINIDDLNWRQAIYEQDGSKVTFYGGSDRVLIDVAGGGNQIFSWDGSTTGAIIDGIQLEEFPLENIDDMRERIFSQPKTSPLVLDWANENAVLPYTAVVGQTEIGTSGFPQQNSNMISYYPMAGLCVKTYQSDRFNNWLSKEWIEQINNISAVGTGGGSFTMDALNLAEKLYKLENQIAAQGGTYQDWLSAVYGETTHGAAEMPVYRGGYSARIVFDEIVSSSDATTAAGYDQPLGSLGGRGTQTGAKGGKLSIKAEEHGYLMIIASITPIIDFSQGNKWFGKLYTMDDIHKPQLDSIGFQELTTDEFAAWDTNDIAAETEEFHSIGKQPSWTHYMTNQNENYGNFARENAEQWMVLDRRYQWDQNGRLEDATTYIDPTKYNYIYAYTGLDAQPYWCQFGIGAKVRRLMAANQMPNI